MAPTCWASHTQSKYQARPATPTANAENCGQGSRRGADPATRTSYNRNRNHIRRRPNRTSCARCFGQCIPCALKIPPAAGHRRNHLLAPGCLHRPLTGGRAQPSRRSTDMTRRQTRSKPARMIGLSIAHRGRSCPFGHSTETFSQQTLCSVRGCISTTKYNPALGKAFVRRRPGMIAYRCAIAKAPKARVTTCLFTAVVTRSPRASPSRRHCRNARLYDGETCAGAAT